MTSFTVSACCCIVQDAIDLAEAGDTVEIEEGTYFEDLETKVCVCVRSAAASTCPPTDIAINALACGYVIVVLGLNDNNDSKRLSTLLYYKYIVTR